MAGHLEKVSRRHFLTGLAAGSLAAFAQQPSRTLPAPEASGLNHVVLVMMENRSFDHFLGWLPGANGRQAGLGYPDFTGQLQPTHHLTDFQGCGFQDPDHSYEAGRIEYDNGKCDGWLRANDVFSIGYYQQNDLAFFGAAAPGWTVCDNYFCAIMAETYPNRIYQHAGQTDRIHNSTTTCLLPTIWDRLQSAGLTGKYYFSDIPFTALWGAKYLGITRPFAEFLADCASGNLPQVSFIDPRFEDETSGTSNDDHPHADVRNGEAFLNDVYRAVTSGPDWPHTLLVINFDEWGGFFDHVPPPTAPIPVTDQLAGNKDGRLGFRTPALLISPWSLRGDVSHIQFDHTSVLKLIEWRWRLASLSVRDAVANNLAYALDFTQPNYFAPLYAVPGGPFGGACPQAATSTEESEWAALQTLAGSLGFPSREQEDIMRNILSLCLLVAIPAAAQRPPIRHVFTIVLENKSYDETFGPNSPAPYLSRQLTAQGELLTNYYGIGHNSLDNYIALVSGQAPNVVTQSDCQPPPDFIPSSTVQVVFNGQVAGQGCVFPAEVQRTRLKRRNQEINTRHATIRLSTSIRSSTGRPAPRTTFP